MKIRNQKGFIIEGVALAIIAVMALFILPPNPISNVLGVGVRPNKTVQTEKVELLTDKDGNPVRSTDGAYLVKHSVSDTDTQQHVTFWEWLRSLPILVLILMGLGVVFPGIAAWRHKAWAELQSDTKKIVHSVNAGLTAIEDPALRQKVLDSMSKIQDSSTKQLVADMKKI